MDNPDLYAHMYTHLKVQRKHTLNVPVPLWKKNVLMTIVAIVMTMTMAMTMATTMTMTRMMTMTITMTMKGKTREAIRNARRRTAR